MAFLVDSSIWVGLYLEFDPHHTKAVRLIESLHRPVYLPNCVIHETVTVLTYKQSRQQAEKFLALMQDHPQIIWIESESKFEIDFFRSLASKISLTDATLLRLAIVLEAELLTYDQQLARLYRKLTKK